MMTEDRVGCTTADKDEEERSLHASVSHRHQPGAGGDVLIWQNQSAGFSGRREEEEEEEADGDRRRHKGRRRKKGMKESVGDRG